MYNVGFLLSSLRLTINGGDDGEQRGLGMGGRGPSREDSTHHTNFLTYCVDKRLKLSVCLMVFLRTYVLTFVTCSFFYIYIKI